LGVASSIFEAFLPKKSIRIRSSAYPRPTKRFTLTFTKQALSGLGHVEADVEVGGDVQIVDVGHAIVVDECIG
jgi:hypothetical protein